MLVLSRKKEETIRINNDITIKVLAIKGQAVRIGIEAPKEVNVVRGELLESQKKDGEESQNSSDSLGQGPIFYPRISGDTFEDPTNSSD